MINELIKPKVVLVSVGVSRREYSQFARFMPMTATGLHYIKAVLEEQGYPVSIVNQTNDHLNDEETAEHIESENPIHVLFNQFFSTRDRIRGILSKLKKDYIIGVGGHDATFNSVALSDDELAQDYQGFDFIWRGEAETGIASLLQNLITKRPLPQIIDNLENRVQELDRLPVLKHDDYSGDVGFLVSSRGCLCSGCDFCTTSSFYKDGRRQRSYKHISQELENLVRAGKKYVFICDDNFLGFSEADLERGNEILKKCKELELKVMTMTTKEQILKAQEKGYLTDWKGMLFRVFLGIENSDESALRKLGKKCNIPEHKEASEKAIKALYENGISLFAGYINFNPWTTFEELERSANFLYQNGMEAANFTNLSQGLRIYEGTKIFKRLSEGRIPFKISNGEFNYEFQDQRVGKFFEYLSRQRRITDILDNLNYETTDLVYINQLQNSDEGQKYKKLRSRINEHNFQFFMGSLIGHKDEICDFEKMSDEFTTESCKLIEEYQKLHLEILEKATYK